MKMASLALVSKQCGTPPAGEGSVLPGRKEIGTGKNCLGKIILGKIAAGKNKYENSANNLTPLFKDDETIKTPHFKKKILCTKKTDFFSLGASRPYVCLHCLSEWAW